MKNYNTPELSVIEIEIEGIICASGDQTTPTSNNIESLSVY